MQPNAPSSPTERWRGMLAAITAISIWALWIPITRLGITGPLAPLDIAALRFLTAGVLMLPILLRHWQNIPWSKTTPLFFLILGAGIPYMLAFGIGLGIANSGQGAVLGPGALSTNVAILAGWAIKEKISRRHWLGIGVVLGGVGFIIAHDIVFGHARIGGFVLIYCASLMWASHTVASRFLRLDPLLSTALVCCGNAILILPWFALTDGVGRLATVPSSALILQIIFQGVLSAIGALVAYAFAIRQLGASTTAIFPPLTPVLATIIGYFLLGDRVELPTIAGLACVLIGVFLSARASRHDAPKVHPTTQISA